jgi:hypothetical protein
LIAAWKVKKIWLAFNKAQQAAYQLHEVLDQRVNHHGSGCLDVRRQKDVSSDALHNIDPQIAHVRDDVGF